MTDIGLYSAHAFGFATLGTGVIILRFHCHGTSDLASDKLYSSDNGFASIGAGSLKNQNGNSFKPEAVDLSVSSCLKTVSSLIHDLF